MDRSASGERERLRLAVRRFGDVRTDSFHFLAFNRIRQAFDLRLQAMDHLPLGDDDFIEPIAALLEMRQARLRFENPIFDGF